jgi:hypothetical protein
MHRNGTIFFTDADSDLPYAVALKGLETGSLYEQFNEPALHLAGSGRHSSHKNTSRSHDSDSTQKVLQRDGWRCQACGTTSNLRSSSTT